MLKTVAFLSEYAAENLSTAVTGNLAMISIVEASAPPARLKDGYRAVLRLLFGDISDAEAFPDGQVWDLGFDGQPLLLDREIVPDGNHARAIVDFLAQISEDDACDHVIVHCLAGISRSAAVARFIADRYEIRIDNRGLNDNGTEFANKRLLRLLNKAADGQPMVVCPCVE